ncbi:D-alanyl-D-alanine dipeptidase [Pedobacter sp. HMF7647]|uniref:D-alanyl-D-alanine dipeptidase n=1 Tax=Hufsiella arboris TaxID=2695275 RepID=A0A7K1Y578_9SPHI|nr:M15 family metallopeptidase [Hufsiella arboris]MXV49743.1 D-alanyl-D-alanine dipeptidase [Hufsiella arboris]
MRVFTRAVVVLFLCGVSQKSFSQANNPYNLPIDNSLQLYNQSLKENPANRLVEIKKAIPSIRLDIRYATTNNFTGKVMYDAPRAFARMPVVKALKQVQAELQKKGLGLKIFDGYRPYAITIKFWNATDKKEFVANPKNGSRHNRGCAVDLTIIDLKTGKEIDMPTGYDSFSEKASPDYSDLPAVQKANRDMLRSVMESHGFKVIDNEWWHFDFTGWEKFALMDIPFNNL